jgi:predicted nucleic acid-binding Zn finger protein
MTWQTHDSERFFVDYISKIFVVSAGIFCSVELTLGHVNINGHEDCMKNGYFSCQIFMLVVYV